MAHIEIVDQTFRDGQQSLWGLRMRTGMVRGAAGDLERAGFRAIDITGSTMFECVVRYSREDPWEGLDLWRSWMPTSHFRAGVGSNRIAKFGMTPEPLIDLWVQTLIKHGIDSFWVYDCLYNLDQMRRLCKTIVDAGGQALGAIMYGISPVHTDAWFAERAAEMCSWPEVSGIYMEDAPGILTPERAQSFVPALLTAAGDKPVEWHCHNNTGLGAVNYVKAVQAGGTILHTCSRPLANGPSLPSTEQTLENLRWLGHTHSIDESRLPPIAEHCRRVAEQEGHPIGVPNEYNVFAYQHHLPGGMTGSLKAQLAQYGMQDRLVEVLEECVRVREELGHPISATPFSQLVGIQSVLNIVSGDRYSVVSDEVIVYLMGKFGEPPAPVDEDVRDKVLSSAHGRRFAGWERPQPSLAELREQYGGSGVSDEELLLRYMVPLEDLQAAYAAGPVNPSYAFADTTTLRDLIDHAMTLKRPRNLRVSTPEGSFALGGGQR
jgi:oxaloacetate decarboxylase alpha subunit